MKVSEIQELTDKEILERIQIESESLTRISMNHAVSPLENPMKIKNSRRDIARLKTVLRQRAISQKQK